MPKINFAVTPTRLAHIPSTADSRNIFQVVPTASKLSSNSLPQIWGQPISIASIRKLITDQNSLYDIEANKDAFSPTYHLLDDSRSRDMSNSFSPTNKNMASATGVVDWVCRGL
jgi:hypothetical protein